MQVGSASQRKEHSHINSPGLHKLYRGPQATPLHVKGTFLQLTGVDATNARQPGAALGAGLHRSVHQQLQQGFTLWGKMLSARSAGTFDESAAGASHPAGTTSALEVMGQTLTHIHAYAYDINQAHLLLCITKTTAL